MNSAVAAWAVLTSDRATREQTGRGRFLGDGVWWLGTLTVRCRGGLQGTVERSGVAELDDGSQAYVWRRIELEVCRDHGSRYTVPRVAVSELRRLGHESQQTGVLFSGEGSRMQCRRRHEIAWW